MWEIVSILQVFLLFMSLFVILFLASKIKEHRLASQDMSVQLESVRKELSGQQATQEELAQQRAWYQALFTNTRDIVMVHATVEGDLPGNFLEVNTLACTRLGYTRDELLAKTPMDIQDLDTPMATSGLTKAELITLSDSYIQSHAKKIATSYVKHVMGRIRSEGEMIYDTTLIAKDGAKIPMQVEASLIDLFDPPVVICVARDTSHIKKAEDALEESQGRLRDFFTCSPFGMAMYDASKTLIQTNRACLRMFGIPDSREFARFRLLDADFLPEDVREKINKGESARYEVALNFDDLVRKAQCVSTRKGRGHFDLIISYMGYDRQYKPRGYLVQVEETTEKRKLEAQLRNVADKGGATAEGTRGSLADITFTDLIQILCAGGRTMQIDLTRPNEKASIYVKDGNVIHCQLADTPPEQAFYKLMQWRTGEFTAKQCASFPEQTITTSLMSLLMEGGRLCDEAGG